MDTRILAEKLVQKAIANGYMTDVDGCKFEMTKGGGILAYIEEPAFRRYMSLYDHQFARCIFGEGYRDNLKHLIDLQDNTHWYLEHYTK